MLYWIIQAIVISFILIYLVHYLIDFFKSTLTVPKIKDLVNTPNEKYNDIFKVINNKSNFNLNNINNINNINSNGNDDYTLIDLLPKTNDNNNLNNNLNNDNLNNSNLNNSPSMKNELKNFLKKQLHNSTPRNIQELDSNLNMTSNNLTYSNF